MEKIYHSIAVYSHRVFTQQNDIYTYNKAPFGYNPHVMAAAIVTLQKSVT